MSTNEREDAAAAAGDGDPVLEWALHERLGGEQPPDLLGAVRAQLARGPETHAVPAGRRGQRVAMAALLLLGAAVVVGVAVWPRERAAATAPAQDPAPEPARHTVQTLNDVAALPDTAAAVEAVGADDAVLAAIAMRCPELRVLVVREPWNEAFGLSPKMQVPADAKHVTPAVWRHVFALKKLRTIRFSGTTRAGVVEPGAMADFVTGLESLPLLTSLTLRCMDTPDAVVALLAKARGLRHLDLSFNHGFEAEGVDGIVKCRSLRSLSLRGCQQLHDRVLAKVAALPELQDLDLSAIDGINWQVGPGAPLPAAVTALRERARRLADRLGMGPGEQTFTALGATKRLRSLDVSGAHWRTQQLALLGGAFLDDTEVGVVLRATGGQVDGIAFVAALPKNLERLEVGGSYGDDFCTALAAHLPNLRSLNVAACDHVTDAGIATLAAMPSLRELDLRQMRGLTAACIDALALATPLEQLDLRHCDFVTPEHVVRLRRALPRLRELQTSVAQTDVDAAAARQDPVQVRTAAEIDALPATTRHVIAFDVEDDCMASLARLHGLHALEIVAAWSSPMVRRPGELPAARSITDAGLRELRSLRSLRCLRLDGQLAIGGAGLDVVRSMPELDDVSLATMVVGDAGIEALAALPRLRRLALRHVQGFGEPAVAAVARCASLRELSLCGCVHVDERWLAQLAALRELESLDLSMIGSRAFFSGFAGHLVPPDPGSGVTDLVAAALGSLPRLRELNLAQAGLTPVGLRSLQRLGRLQSLDLSGVELQTADLRTLPPSLTSLTLRGFVASLDGIGADLAAALPALRTLDLLGSPGLGPNGLSSLAALRTLRSLDVSYCPRLADGSSATAEQAVQRIARLPWLEELTLRGWPLGDAALATLRAMPNLRRLDSDAGTQRLRPR